MKRTKGYGLSREGWPYLLAVGGVAELVGWMWSWAWSIPLWIVMIFLFYCFRRSERIVPPSPLGIVSPVDGRIMAVDEVTDPFLQRPAKRITLRIHRLGEYALRAPTEGKLLMQWHMRRGTLRAQGRAGERAADEQALRQRAKRLDGLWIQTDEADDVVVELKVAAWPKPRCYGLVGERVGQGQRCGFMPFGGTLAVYLPSNSKIHVAAGENVFAGCDLIAALVHHRTVGIEGYGTEKTDAHG